MWLPYLPFVHVGRLLGWNRARVLDVELNPRLSTALRVSFLHDGSHMALLATRGPGLPAPYIHMGA